MIIDNVKNLDSLVNALNTTAMSDFMGMSIALVIVALAMVTGMCLVGWLRIALQSFDTEEESEVIECLSAEDVDLQSYMVGEVQVFNRAKSGRFYSRRKMVVQAQTAHTEIKDEVEYSASAYVAAEDAGVMHTDLVTTIKQKVECVRFQIARFQVFTLVPAALLVFATILPAAQFIDDVVAMPATVKELKAQNEVLKSEIEKVNRKVAIVDSSSKTTAVKVMIMQKDPTDAPEPMNVRS